MIQDKRGNKYKSTLNIDAYSNPSEGKFLVFLHPASNLVTSKLTLLGTCTYSNYNNSYSKYYEYKGNVISRIT